MCRYAYFPIFKPMSTLCILNILSSKYFSYIRLLNIFKKRGNMPMFQDFFEKKFSQLENAYWKKFNPFERPFLLHLSGPKFTEFIMGAKGTRNTAGTVTFQEKLKFGAP